jgi:aryl-alcohol dehydrogenase-like predicted oxidoreductase
MPYTKTYKLGGDLEVNRIGFGAMRITSKDNFGMPDNPQNSIDVLRRAVELGVNFIDTADQYGMFASEQLISDALHPYKDGLVIATKGGLVRFGASNSAVRHINNDATPQHLHEALNGSSARLKIKKIDLYQLHRIDPNVPVDITFEFLAKAQKDGRVKHLGLSEVSVDEIKQAQKHFKVVSVQNRYSVSDRRWEDVLDYCEAQGIAFIPFLPMGGGKEMQGEDVLQKIAARHGATIRQIALSWLLYRSDNILLIPGTSNIDHLEENMAAGGIELAAEDIQELNAIAG